MKNEPEQLLDAVDSTHDITCEICKQTKLLHGYDSFDAVEEFFNLGWRKPRERVYCPKCAKEKLKS